MLWPLVIAAVVAVIVIAALVINSQSGPDDTAATTPVTIPPATTTSQSETTSTTTTTETPEGFDAMRQVVTSYYAQLPDDTGSAWKMLSDSYQEQTGGRREYQNFWSSIQSVSVDSVSPRDDTSVSAQLTYVLRNGSTSSERRWFQIDEVDGTPVIADSGLG